MGVRTLGGVVRISRPIPRLLVFDWDGTLMDSTEHIIACVQSAARDLRVSPPGPDEVREIINIAALAVVDAQERLGTG